MALKRWNVEEFGFINRKQQQIVKDLNELEEHGDLVRKVSRRVWNFNKTFGKSQNSRKHCFLKSLGLDG